MNANGGNLNFKGPVNIVTLGDSTGRINFNAGESHVIGTSFTATAGNVNLNANLDAPTFQLQGSSVLNIDSSGSAITLTSNTQLSLGGQVNVNCNNNNIALSGSSTWPSGSLTVGGTGSCKFSATLGSTFSSALVVNNAQVRLATGTNAFAANVNINGGSLLANSINLSPSVFTLTGSGNLGSTTAGNYLPVKCNSLPCGLILNSATAVMLDLDSSFGSGSVTSGNGNLQIFFGGSQEMVTNTQWTFNQCQQISLNKNWRMESAVDLGKEDGSTECPLTISSGDLTVKSTLKVNSDLIVSGNSDITSIGTITVTNAKIEFSSSSTGTLDASSINLSGGTIKLEGGSSHRLGNVQGTGTLTINAPGQYDIINLSGSIITVSKSFTGSGSSTLTLTGSSITITSPGNMNLPGTVTLLSSSNFQYTSSGTITITNLQVTGSTVTLSGTTTIKSISATNPTISHTAGKLTLEAQNINGGSIQSSGTGLQLEGITIQNVNSFSQTSGTFTTASSVTTSLQSTTLDVSTTGVVTVNQLTLSSNSEATFTNCASTSSFVLTSISGSKVSIKCTSNLAGGALNSGSTLETYAQVTFASTATFTQNPGSTIDVFGILDFQGGDFIQNGGEIVINSGGTLKLSTADNFSVKNGDINIDGGQLSLQNTFSPGGSQLIGSDGTLVFGANGKLQIGTSTLVDLSSVDVTLTKEDQITWADVTSSRINLKNANVVINSSPKDIGRLDLGGSIITGSKGITLTIPDSALFFTGGTANVSVPITLDDYTSIQIDSATVEFKDKVKVESPWWYATWKSKLSTIVVKDNINFKSWSNSFFFKDAIRLTDSGTLTLEDNTATYMTTPIITNITQNYNRVTVKDWAYLVLISSSFLPSSKYFDTSKAKIGIQLWGTTTLSGSDVIDLGEPCTELVGVVYEGEPQLLKIESTGELTILGCLALRENATISSLGSIIIDGGSLTSNASNVFINDGKIILGGDTLSFFNQSYLLVKGLVDVTTNSNFEFKDSSKFVLGDNADLRLKGDNVTLSILDSTMEGNGGTMKLNGSSFWSSDNSLVHFNITTLLAGNDAKLEFLSSIVQIETSAVLADFASVSLNNTLLDISGILTSSYSSNIDINPKSELLCTGQVLLEDTLVTLDIDSNITISNSGYFSLTNSSIHVGSTSSFSVTAGTFVNEDGGKVNVTNSASVVQISNAIIDLNANSEFDLYIGADIVSSSIVTLTGGDLNLYSGVIVNLESLSLLTVDSTGNVNMNGASLTIDGTLSLSNSGSIVGVDSDVTFNSIASSLSGGKIDLSSTSTIDIKNDLNEIDSFVILDGSTINFNPSVSKVYNFQNGSLIFTNSNFNLDIGEMTLHSNTVSTITYSNVSIAGKLTIQTSESDFSNSIVHLSGDILVQTQSNATFTKTSLTSDSSSSTEVQDSTVDVSAKSDLEIEGLISTGSLLSVRQSTISLFTSGSFSTSTAHFEATSFLNVKTGTTTFSDASELRVEFSTVSVDGILSFINNTTFNVSSSSVNIHAGASFIIEDPAKILSSTGSYSVQGIIKSFGANLNFNPSNEILITSGGRFYTYNTTQCDMFKSFITIDDGAMAVYDNTTLNFDDNSYIQILKGDFSSYDSVIISLLTSTSYIQIVGTLNAHDYSKYYLYDAYLSIDGIGTYTGHSELNLMTSAATFTIDGALIFTDHSVLNLHSGNSINVRTTGTQPGLLDFHGDVIDSWDSVVLNIEGKMAIYERASINITQSTITISGVFFTDNDLHFHTSESDFLIQGVSPRVYLNGTSLSQHSFTDSDVTVIAGTLEVLGDTSPLFERSVIFISGGSMTSSFNSAPTFKDSTVTVSTSGLVGLTFNMKSKPYFSNTTVTVNGIVSFTDDEESQFHSSFLSVIGSVTFLLNASNEFYSSNLTVNSLMNGGVYFQNNSTSSFSTGIITVSDGAIRALDSAYISALSTSINILDGDMLLYSYSKLELLDQFCPIVIDTGNLRLYDNSKLITYPGTVITIFSGSFSTHDDVNLNFGEVKITIDTGSFDLNDQSQLTLTESEVTIRGSFDLNDQSQLTLAESEVTIRGSLDVFENSHLTLMTSEVYISGFLRTHSQISLIAQDTLFFVNGLVSFDGLVSSVHSLSNCGLEVLGNVVFTGSIDPEFLQNTYIVIHGGSFQIYDNVDATVDNSTLTLAADQDGVFGLYNTSTISFTMSPIKMYGGNILLKDYSDFYFDATSTIGVYGGDFLVQGHADVFATPFCSITVQRGNFIVSDYVDIDFDFITIDVAGNFESHNSTSLYFQSSEINVAPGTFKSAEYASLLLENTTLSVISGSFQVYDNTTFSSINSSVVVTTNGKAKNRVGGQFVSYGDSKLSFSSESTLIVDGEFTTYDKSAFTSTSTYITVLNGTFSNLNTSTFTAQDTHINVTGKFLLSDNSSFSSTNSIIDILGTFLNDQSSEITISQCNVTIVNGNFETQNGTQFSIDNSNLNVLGNVNFRGNSSSVQIFDTDNILIQSGNLTITENTTPTFTDTYTKLLGGYHNQYMYSKNYYSNSTLSVAGEGTLTMLGYSYWSLEDSSLAEIVSEGASAIFCDYSLFEVKSDSTFNITNGQITFCSNAKLNLYPNTHFNLLDGSFYLRDSAVMVAYQGTTGTINGGNMYVMDQASLIFVNSKLKVQGAINHNSTIPIRILTDSSIVIDGSPVTISGEGVLEVNDGAYLSILDNSLILRDHALVDANRGNIIISGGNILAYDYSKVSAINESYILIDGGNITTNDNSEFYAENSLITVSTTANSKGYVYVQGSSVMTLTDGTTLNVNLGTVSLHNDGKLVTQDSSTINVSGDILFDDYSSFSLLSSSSLSVTQGGNFIASGVGSSLFISDSDISVDSGDMFFSYRTTLKSESSSLFVSNGGTLVATDLSFITLDQSIVSVTGGGDLLLQRQASFNAVGTSITVDNDGNALFTEGAVLSLESESILTVQNGGSILFKNDTQLSSSGESQCIVVGGGSISFSDNAVADLTSGASWKVQSGGDIVFSESSGIDLQSNSYLYVSGGDIQFTEESTISSDFSSLIVENGNIVLSGSDSLSRINNNSNFIVSNGRIEFRGSRIVIFNHSNMKIFGGDLITYDYTQFIFINQSAALIDGGNFISTDYSKVRMDNSKFTVNKGSVQFQNYAEISLTTSTISITNDVPLGESGSFNVTDYVKFSINHSLVEVTGGNFDLDSSASLVSQYSSIEVSSGSALFSGESTYDGLFSSVKVSGGDLSIFGNSLWNVTSSSAEVTDGNLNIYENTFTNLDNSSFAISNGNCNIFNTSTFWMRESSLRVTGGNLSYNGTTQFQGNFSSISVSGGKLIYDSSSNISLFESTITVNLSVKRSTSGVDILIFKGSTDFYSFATGITVTSGNMHYTDLSSSYLENTQVTVNGGNLIHSSSTNVVFDATNVLITSGSLQIIGSSNSNVKNFSNITVDGGNLILADSPIFSVLQSYVTVISGTSSFTGGNINFQQSSLNVTSNGNINFGGSSNSHFSQSLLSLSGNGLFSLTGSSRLQVTDASTINIYGGSFTTTDSSKFVVIASNYYINGGYTTFTGSSTADIISSIFVISAGDIIYTGNSVVTIHSGSNYQVTGGNIITSGTASLSIDQSCFTVDTGSVAYTGSSSVTLTSSCWNVNGGDVNFSGNTNYNLLSQSNLTLSKGNFVTSESAEIQVDHSSVFLFGGSFSTLQSSTTNISSSVVLIEQGSASWNDDSNFKMYLSSFTVKGGEVQFNGRSKTFWTQSSLFVNNGDTILNDYTNSQFVDTSVFVSGSIQFKAFSHANFEGGSLSISIGSMNFLDYTQCYFHNSAISIFAGNLQYVGHSNLTIADSTITIKGGKLEFLNQAEVIFTNSDISLNDGSVDVKDQVNVQIDNCSFYVSGDFYAQNSAELSIIDSSVLIEGSMQLVDTGSFFTSNSVFEITSGNLIVVNNDDSTRKEVSFVQSTVNVHNSANQLNGNIQVVGNADLTLLGSNFTIDGDLSLSGNSVLYVHQISSFIIPSGVVTMDQDASISISQDSIFSNMGTIFTPGTISFPSGASVSNSGFMQSNHNLNINCGANGPVLKNTGSLFFNQNELSCVDNLEHTGLMQISGSNVTLQTYSNDRSSTVVLTESTIHMSLSNLYESNGSFGGRGVVQGNFQNKPGATIMSTGDFGVTSLRVTEDFSSSGTIFFMINSRDLSDPNSYSVINADRSVDLQGGRVCICFSPLLDLIDGDKWDLIQAQSLLQGNFDQVDFACQECPVRTTRNVASTEATCEPTADYGSRSFSVFFEACGGGSGSNFLTNITPPYYVIIPVAVGIILLVTLIFGGALLLDERMRRRKATRKAKLRRKKLVKELQQSSSQAVASSNSSI